MNERFRRTIADVEASGYTAICVPVRNGQPGCSNHGHMPGARKPEPLRITPAADNALTLFDVTGGAA